MAKSKQDIIYEFDKFTDGYVECLLWAETYDPEGEGSGGSPLEEDFGVEDFTLKAIKLIRDDCKAFQEANARDLERYYAAGYDESYAGHDFWLTRNGHGAGFWDRGLGELGRRLTDAAHAYGSLYPMVFRGKIHLD